MRRWSLVLLLSLAAPSLAQDAPAEPPAPAPAPAAAAEKKPAPAPAAPRPAPAAPPVTESDADTRASLREDARFLLNYLLTGDVRGSVPLFAFPFQLEERRFDAPDTLIAAWVKQLRNKRTDLITLYDVEVLPYADFEKKYGKPPARLGAIVPKGVEVYAALANLSGRGAVILYRPTLEGWRAFAYTD